MLMRPKKKPIPKQTLLDTSTYVPALLSTLNNRLTSGASDLYLTYFGIGINEWRILTVLARWPECNAKFVSEESATHVSVISRSLREMQNKGLVDIDASVWQRSLSLTPQGQALYDQIARVALIRESLLLEGFTPEDKEVLLDLLKRLSRNIDLVNAYDPAEDDQENSLPVGTAEEGAPGAR